MDGKILILGGTGFIGRNFTEYLCSKGETVVSVGKTCSLPSISGNFNLLCDTIENLIDLIQEHDIRYVFNLVGMNGGIKYNLEHKYDIFTNNIDIYNDIFFQLERCPRIKKIVSLVASCAYPDTDQNLEEKHFLSGNPAVSIEGHAYAKRHLFILSKLFSEHKGIPAVCACPPTIFGPYDHMDDRAKVVDSMILRCIKSAQNNDEIFEVWGDGSPLRQVMYVKDLCPLLLDVMYKYDDPNLPINLSSPYEVSIAELAVIIMDLVGHPGEIQFNPAKPNGQMHKFLDAKRMHKYLGEAQFQDLRDSLEETVEYYKDEVRHPVA